MSSMADTVLVKAPSALNTYLLSIPHNDTKIDIVLRGAHQLHDWLHAMCDSNAPLAQQLRQAIAQCACAAHASPDFTARSAVAVLSGGEAHESEAVWRDVEQAGEAATLSTCGSVISNFGVHPRQPVLIETLGCLHVIAPPPPSPDASCFSSPSHTPISRPLLRFSRRARLSSDASPVRIEVAVGALTPRRSNGGTTAHEQVDHPRDSTSTHTLHGLDAPPAPPMHAAVACSCAASTSDASCSLSTSHVASRLNRWTHTLSRRCKLGSGVSRRDSVAQSACVSTTGSPDACVATSADSCVESARLEQHFPFSLACHRPSAPPRSIRVPSARYSDIGSSVSRVS
eukprot:CAMPEP_0196668566 /NCGR_PEP_ID=MMETSP1086-20130531/65692_1 /TAXON_ID=77921 /ORGANISM="Cyanoptyche  gloeocystis , Strain SAG4.97" /LENGTH=342 /DNA_ID=CAMNT_0042005987 /DNA_START=136 /DNA_END=1161 /DNA_ORIENTATION=+